MTAATAIGRAVGLALHPELEDSLDGVLPKDTVLLVRVASGDKEALAEGMGATGHGAEFLRKAAERYLLQVVFRKDADSYTLLCASPSATREELRANMALLVHWLHPDVSNLPNSSVLSERVIKAWSDLKSHKKRSDYDRKRSDIDKKRSEADKKRSGGKPTRAPSAQHSARLRKFARARMIGQITAEQAAAERQRARRARRRTVVVSVVCLLSGALLYGAFYRDSAGAPLAIFDFAKVYALSQAPAEAGADED